jgi:hypothetical protein
VTASHNARTTRHEQFAALPIHADGDGNRYVRQKGYEREKWDLFCLDLNNSSRQAAESLRDEIALAQRYEDEY